MLLSRFGERIKTIRERQGIFQNRIFELTGIGREQISRIEHGQINPTLETIYKLSVAFDVPMKELLDFEVDKIIPQYVYQKENYKIKPFVKWAGGKTQILDKIKDLLPDHFNTYYEPFVGGGALLFSIKPKSAVINDINKDLYEAFQCFNDQIKFEKMIKELIDFEEKHGEEYYYEVREMDRKPDYPKLPDYKQAARLIYLNKACFNGLYRVNSKGFFNVPSGKKLKVRAYDKENFDGLREYFSNNDIQVLSEDFEKATEGAMKGDFVYFDPPYDTFEEQTSFTAYSKDSFGKQDQARLAETFRKLNDKGVLVMLSNHNTKYVNELYNGFNIQVITARRMINSNAKGRGDVEEVIITNYK